LMPIFGVSVSSSHRPGSGRLFTSAFTTTTIAQNAHRTRQQRRPGLAAGGSLSGLEFFRRAELGLGGPNDGSRIRSSKKLQFGAQMWRPVINSTQPGASMEILARIQRQEADGIAL
jgi:hypothetical protein